MITKLESKTLKNIFKEALDFWGGFSILVTIVSGTIYSVVTSAIIKMIAILLLVVSLLFFFLKIFIDTADKRFKKVENLEDTQDKIINTLNTLQNSTSLIDGISKNISDIGLAIPKICSSIETVEDDINSEIIDFIFIKDKSGDSGKLILIVKCNESIDHTYKLTILSTDISAIKVAVDIPVGKKYNVIEMQDANNRDLERPYIEIKFKIKKGINIGIVKINIIGEIRQLFGIQFSLSDLTLSKTIIENTTLNFENT